MANKRIARGISKVINKLHGIDNPAPLQEGKGYSTEGAGTEIKKTPQQREIVKKKVNEHLIWDLFSEGKFEEALKLVGNNLSLLSPDQREIMDKWMKIQQEKRLQEIRQETMQQYGVTEADVQRANNIRAQRAQLEQMGKNFASGSGPITSTVTSGTSKPNTTKKEAQSLFDALNSFTPSNSKKEILSDKQKDPEHTKVTPGRVERLKKGDSEADVLGKMLNFMKKQNNWQKKKEIDDKKYRVKLNNQKDSFTNEIIEAVGGKRPSTSGKRSSSFLTKKMAAGTRKSGFLKYGLQAAVGIGGFMVAKDALANINWNQKFDETFKDFKFPELNLKGPNVTSTTTTTSFDSLKKKISGPESKGDYNIMNIVEGAEKTSNVKAGNTDAFGQKYDKNLTDMTLEEVIKLGKARGEKFGEGKGAAAGKYQFMPIAIEDIGPKTFGKDWKSVKFSETNQEKMMDKLIEVNAGKLEKANLPVTDVNMYMMHFFGNTGQVKKFNEASDKDKMSSVLGPAGSAANKNVSEMSVGAYKKKLMEEHKFTGEVVSKDTKTETKTSAVPVVPNIKGIEELTSFTARNPAEARKYNSYGAPRKRATPHQGIDLGRTEGAPVIARETGKVVHVGSQRGYGYTVTLDHGNGYSTFYAHLKEEPDLKNGQIIQRGEAFAKVGHTTGANGEKDPSMVPHLHFELRKNGEPQSNVEQYNIDQSKKIMQDRESVKGTVTIGPLSKSNSNKNKTLGVLNNTNIIQGPTIYQVSEEYVSTYSPATQKLYGYA